MKLYEIPKALQDILEVEDQELQIKLLKELKGETDQKIINITKIIGEHNQNIIAIGEEIDRLTARKKTLENKIKGLKGYVMMFMGMIGVRKFKHALYSLSIINKQPRVEIIDESLIPLLYISEKTIKQIDKIAIKEAMKQGQKIEGIKLIDNEYYLKIK